MAWRDVGGTLAWAGLYAALAVAVTWPLATGLTDHLPTGNVHSSAPALAATWALWWVSDRLPYAFVGLWDAPIFFPVEGTFAFSEPSLALGVVAAPLFWLGAPPALVTNVVVLGCLVGNGLAARLVARQLDVGSWAAGGAGALMVSTAVTLRNVAVLPVVPLFGILLVFSAMLRFARAPGPAAGAALGGAYALTVLMSLQAGLFVTLVAPLFAVAVRGRPRAVLQGLAVGAVLAGLLVLPVVIPQRAHLAAQGFQRSETRATAGAAQLRKNWLNPPRRARIPLPDVPRTGGAGLYPGLIPALLVVGGVAARRRDRRVWALVACALASVALSNLPHWSLGGWRPYALLRDGIPALALVRETRRAGAVAIALIPVLASLGLAEGAKRAAWAPVLLVAVAIAHYWPAPQRLQATPSLEEHAPLIAALRTRVPDDGAVAFLPFEPPDVETPQGDRMLLQTRHGRPMVNGYSSYFPRSYRTLKKAFLRGPSAAGFDALRGAGVTHVVAPPDWADAAQLAPVWAGEDEVLFSLVDPRSDGPP